MQTIPLLFLLLTDAATTAAAMRSCASNHDCQLNGKCSAAGVCQCDPAWTGDQCHRLALLPANPDSGLQDPILSSWGGSVLQNHTDGVWHMYVCRRSFMLEPGPAPFSNGGRGNTQGPNASTGY
jgi:hypothetical protein